MPRYRFNWDNVPSRFLAALCEAGKLSNGNCSESLRNTYGARPKADFVRDNWPVLRDRWLARDATSRAVIVKQLRDWGLGARDSSVRTAADQLTYLQTCHNQVSLREVVLAQFLAIGEVSSTNPPITPAPVPKPTNPETAVQPLVAPAPEQAAQTSAPVETAGKNLSLIEFVEAVLREGFKSPDIARDKSGDITLRAGSSLCFIRAVEKANAIPYVDIFAPLLGELKKSPELLDTLNEINLGLTFAKVIYTSANEVVLALEVPAPSINADQVMWATRYVMESADYFDTQISKRYGGKKWFDDTAPAINV